MKTFQLISSLVLLGAATKFGFGGNGTWPFRMHGQAQEGATVTVATAQFSSIGNTSLNQTAALSCQLGNVDLFSAAGALKIGTQQYAIKAVCDSLHSDQVEIIAERSVGGLVEQARFSGHSDNLSNANVEMQGQLTIAGQQPRSMQLKLAGEI